ncbi:polysaccharide deacetylase family protein [Fibrobacterales bacterium]|nr:polysaccharide deacetylase family protein [Fibrobacterales bacterium]
MKSTIISLLTIISTGISAQLAPNQMNPLDLPTDEIPMFIILGFDDNPNLRQGLLDSLSKRKNKDGSPVLASFYSNTTASSNQSWIDMHKKFAAAGHEIALHTHSHISSNSSSQNEIQNSIEKNKTLLSENLKVNENLLTGFRTPFLEVNDKVLISVENLGLTYDCSIEEGYQDGHEPGNYNWPYTLDNGASKSWDKIRKFGWMLDEPINSHPGIWEIPVYTWLLPPDSVSESYGVPKGFRTEIQKRYNSTNPFWPKDLAANDWKIEGFDYNIWDQYKFTDSEFTAVLKYNFDRMHQGNKTPFTIGLHSSYYGEGYNWDYQQDTDKALFDFIDYATQFSDVRFITAQHLVDWLEKPTPISPILTENIQEFSNFEIYNIKGELIQAATPISKLQELDKSLPQGMWILKTFNNSGNSFTQKIIIQ